ncbi:MAG TPA: hydroxylamine oxidation protein HaoB [Rubrivivax sp.]|nr:hydroxylamine oxidation protein HaoB [Rubrivivax sp.]
MSAAVASAGAVPPVPAARARAALRLLALLLGLALLALAALTAWQHFGAAAPYRYVEPRAATTPGEPRTVQVIAAAGERLLAEADVVAAPDGPLLLDWRARVDDPMLYLPAPREETQALAAVLARHRAPDTPVLAWWDTSRRLRHWGAGAMRFDRHLGEPLFVPRDWSAQKARVLEVERAYWGAAADPAQRAAFDTFARALVAPEAEGVALLRTLVPAGKAVVVVHLRDALLLGQMFPKAIGVAFQDFADTGDVHRSVRGVRGWLKEGEHSAYGLVKLPGNVVRVVALRDEASANTLIARLLPFVGNRQDDVRGLTLVYRSGAFAVYELSPADAP